ncbi:transposase [Nocardia sp. Root136]|uniref:IS110 family transposase n=1 Tax=Nocardia sp. Root136 TaxID=1736458 RepID=UPI0006FD2EFF|nr:IS110 family transposase [Nocardia sp. Root136]KQY32268.1 transposase [Nocardia sp. Root136]
MAAVACGVDWAQDHHDVAVVDHDGKVVASERISDSAEGLTILLRMLVEHDPTDAQLPIAIETSRGLLVAGLRAAGRKVFAINPFSVSRYRDRYRSSRGKSDAFDAMVLANILRTDIDTHRPLSDDSVEVQALRVLTRAQQDAVWEGAEVTNRIRTLLKAFFPMALSAFERGGRHRLDSAACRTILSTAPTPEAARSLTVRRLSSLLKKAGRQRGIDEEATRLHAALRQEAMHQPAAVERAMGLQLQGLLRQLDAICDTVAELEEAVETAFHAHPDSGIVSSFPGVGTQLGARFLAEIGDDRARFADARGLRAFAGAAPVTRASGKSSFVHARRAKNNRLATTGYVWALAAVRHDKNWEALYRARRDHGDRHTAALRRLFSIMLSKLHYCLKSGRVYNPAYAFTVGEIPAAA